MRVSLALMASLVAPVGGVLAIDCGSFSGSDTTDSDRDAGSAVSDGGLSSTPDGSSPGDGGGEKNEGSCLPDAGLAFLSANFEETPPRYYVRGKPSGLPQAAAPTTIHVDDGGTTCGANALDIQMNRVAYTLDAPAQAVGFTAHKLIARFDVLFEALGPTTGDETLFALGFVNPAFKNCFAYLQTLNAKENDFGIQTHCGAGDSTQYVAKAIPNPVNLGWYHVTFVLDLEAQVASLSFNGLAATTLALKTTDVSVGADVAYASVGLDQGPSKDAGAVGHVRFDNIRVDVE